jgi:hypothetical protein
LSQTTSIDGPSAAGLPKREPAADGVDALATASTRIPLPPRELSLLEPDILVHAAAPSRRGSDHGPLRLLLALLEDAIKRLPQRGEAAREALAWFDGEQTSWGSFLHVCEALDLGAPERIRAYAHAVAARAVAVTRFHRRVRYRGGATADRN